MSEQTAVEWLVNAIHVYIHESKDQYLLELLEQAKKMEKEQIINAYQSGGIDGQIFALTRKINNENGEQYYKETYQDTK
jgi:hypothetical protein